MYYENISHYRDFEFFGSLGEVTGDRIRGITDALARSPRLRRSMCLTIARLTISRLRFAGRYASEALRVR